jgi:hypothetical protein
MSYLGQVAVATEHESQLGFCTRPKRNTEESLVRSAQQGPKEEPGGLGENGALWRSLRNGTKRRKGHAQTDFPRDNFVLVARCEQNTTAEKWRTRARKKRPRAPKISQREVCLWEKTTAPPLACVLLSLTKKTTNLIDLLTNIWGWLGKSVSQTFFGRDQVFF